MPDLLTTVSILLAVVSATLAISAFIFSWVTFRNTSKMQMDAQAILTRVSEKVEVVVERTSHQIDRAWDYFTGLPAQPASRLSEEVAKKEQEQREQILEEARNEATQVIQKAGLDAHALKALVEKVEGLIAKSTERAGRLFEQQQLLLKFSEIERELTDLFRERGISIPPDIPPELLLGRAQDLLGTGPSRDLDRLIRLRNMAVHGDFGWPAEELRHSLLIADRLLDYLKSKRGHFEPGSSRSHLDRK